MKDRIIEFIEVEDLTPAEFADKIGVQRSSVSHVLNGRNNPGFAFIQKILEAFPALNSRWLLTGSGVKYETNTILNTNINASTDLFSTPTQEAKKEKTTTPPPANDAPQIIKNEVKQESEPKIETKSSEKKVKRVLIFYEDHTFEDFRPAD